MVTATVRDFVNYLNNNKDKINLEKLKSIQTDNGLFTIQTDNAFFNRLYQEWRDTETLPRQFRITPLSNFEKQQRNAKKKSQQDFVNYLINNKDEINLEKLKSIRTDKALFNRLYQEWRDTETLPRQFRITPWSNFEKKQQDTKQETIETNIFSDVWTYASDNIMQEKLEDTWKAFEQRQRDTAKELSDIYDKSWKKQSALTELSQQWARKRYDAQQEQLDKNKEAAESRIEKSRWMADDVLKRQESIAARQANIWAAQAGQSWLQMSESAISDVKNDMIATYGTNLANAEQFRAQTNISLDDALIKVASDIFSNKQAVDNFVNMLDEKELQPLLNATLKAEQWDVDAVNAIKDYYNAILNKKAEEEYNRFARQERLSDNERIWQASSPAQRLAILQDQFREYWVTDAYISNPEKYVNMTFAEAENTIMKDVLNLQDKDKLLALATQYVASEKDMPEWLKETIKHINDRYGWTVSRTDVTHDEKEGKILTDSWMTDLSWKETVYNTIQQQTLWQNSKNILEKAVKQKGKQVALNQLKLWLNAGKISEEAYNQSVRYVNSLSTTNNNNTTQQQTLSQNNKNTLDKVVKQRGKQVALNQLNLLLKDNKISKEVYDKSIQYVNSLSNTTQQQTLSQNNKNSLDKVVKEKGKQATLNQLRLWLKENKISKEVYDQSIQYINSKY